MGLFVSELNLMVVFVARGEINSNRQVDEPARLQVLDKAGLHHDFDVFEAQLALGFSPVVAEVNVLSNHSFCIV